jgi:outer membrane protein assembly factor BamA
LVIDFRDQAFDPSVGFKLELAGLYHGPEIGDSPFRYGRFLADLALFLPLYRFDEGPVVLGLHGRIEVVDASLARVPFYELPSLGGSTTLRGYLEGRLRDRHSLLVQGELRFPVWRVLKGAAFVEIGRVYDKITDPLDPPFVSHFLWSAGAGIRFVLHPDILVRLDFGVSTEEGVEFWLAFGHAF